MSELDQEEKDLDTELESSAADTDPEPPKDPVDKNADVEVQVGPSRQEKKRNRMKEFEERTTRAEQAAEEARREAREARERFETLNRHPQSQQSSPQGQVSPVQQRLNQIAEAKKRLHETYEAVASQPGYDRNGPRQREFEQQAEQLENARVAAISEAQRPQFDEGELMRKVALKAYLDSHSDISADPNKWAWAHARWLQRKAEGHADTREMADEVFDEARVKFGLRPRNRIGTRPDQATQRRLSGIGSQSAGAPDNVSAIKMTPMERKMAEVKYDTLPKEKAWQKWANTEGKKVMAKRAQR